MQKIKNLIDPSALSSDTRLVLVNAIYFKADWKFPFVDKKFTREKSFYAEDVSEDINEDIFGENEVNDEVRNSCNL